MNYIEIFCRMLFIMDFSIDVQDDGRYCIIDHQDAYLGDPHSYDNYNNDDIERIIDRLSLYIEDYFFVTLEEASAEYLGNDIFYADNIPFTAKEWVDFLNKYPYLKETYNIEYDICNLISLPKILKSIKLSDVVAFEKDKIFN